MPGLVSENGPVELSVVMPVFNTNAEWLLEAVLSVEEASKPRAELILVDDGSTDAGTLAALSLLKQRGLKIVEIENSGPSAARNAGIAAGQGEFILSVDSDDLLGSAFCIPATEVLRAKPDVSVVAGAWELFGARSERISVLREFTLKDFLRANQVSVTSMFRRSLWEELGGFDEALRGAFEDYEWWIRVMSQGGVGVGLDATAVHYRLGHESENSLATSTAELKTDAVLRTRDAVLRNNSAQYPFLLRAALEALDEVTLDEKTTKEVRRLRSIGFRYAAIDQLLGSVPGGRRLSAEFNDLLSRIYSSRKKGSLGNGARSH